MKRGIKSEWSAHVFRCGACFDAVRLKALGATECARGANLHRRWIRNWQGRKMPRRIAA